LAALGKYPDSYFFLLRKNPKKTLAPWANASLVQNGLIQWNTDFNDLPSIIVIWTQMLFCFFLADFAFYWGHRALHTKALYWVHKIHHESKNCVAMGALSVHPIELLIVDGATALIGIIALGGHIHVVTGYTWILWQVISNVDDHCGYEFPWMCTKIFPWSASNTFHNYHHLINIGNYSAHMLMWDSIFGTDIEFLDHFDGQHEKKFDEKTITKICKY
jgi:sterol desaturase/sphingolipid hydroxylase (fatty acid hydroxylase superfamily)